MTQKSPIVEVAKRVCPAVITVVVTKDLPKVEGFYFFPYGGRQFIVPQVEKDKKEKTKIGGGSGFIISSDGYVLTCNHVVADPSASYTVIIDPTKEFEAKVLARDPLIDVAILKIKGKSFPYLEMADSSKTELGESVVAVGNPLGEFEDTISSGIISGLSRKITARGAPHLNRSTSLRGLIQTDAAINPGNSGGPLVDMNGKAIGINTAMVMGAQNIGFAIPINYAKRDFEELVQHGKIKKPFLGVRYFILNKEIAKANKLPIDYGALIVRENLGESAVVKGSPADKAGLREYDIIIESDGKKVNEENPLAEELQHHRIGDEIKLKVLREGKELNVTIKLGEKK
jgi:serine protease Do